jgi:hypothetical protein
MSIRDTMIERVVLGALSLSFFVGIWHGFPSVTTIADEMFFVGGVLRAIEHHTLLPAFGDVPYGTVMYLISYLFSIPFLTTLFVFCGFSVIKLKVFLLTYPWVMYGFLRCVSATSGVLLLVFLNRFLRSIVVDTKTRLALLTLLFSTQLVNFIFHTAKVWVLSTVLLVGSFVYVYRALTAEQERSFVDAKKYSFYVVLASFLAFANLPIMGFALLSVPILFWNFRQNRELCLVLCRYIAFGVIIFIAITALNSSSISVQVGSIFKGYLADGSQSRELVSIPHSILLNLEKMVLLFPLVFIIFLGNFRTTIANRRLFFLSLTYLITYVLLISIVARWSTTVYSFYRYLTPIAFFLVFLVSSLNLVGRRLVIGVAVFSFILLGVMLYRLSIPDLYQQLRIELITEMNREGILLVNRAGSTLELPKNAHSYGLIRPEFCATRCIAEGLYGINRSFLPLVIDAQMSSTTLTLQNLGLIGEVYVFTSTNRNVDTSLTLMKKFTNNTDDTFNYTADNIGSYFNSLLFSFTPFGSNIYVYKNRNITSISNYLLGVI